MDPQLPNLVDRSVPAKMKATRKSEGTAIAGSALQLVAFLAIFVSVASIDDRCAACNAVAVPFMCPFRVAIFVVFIVDLGNPEVLSEYL